MKRAILTGLALLTLTGCKTGNTIANVTAAQERAVAAEARAYLAQVKMAALVSFYDGGSKPIGSIPCAELPEQPEFKLSRLTVKTCTVAVPSEDAMIIDIEFTNGLHLRDENDVVTELAPAR